MFTTLLSPFRSDLAVYITGEHILIGTQTELLAKQSTCVAVQADTRRVLAVGDEAFKMKGKEPPNIEVVQPYQGGSIHDVDIAEAGIRYLLKKHMPRKLIPPRVVISGQMNSETAKRALKSAFTRAGVSEVMLLETAMAAAIGIGLKIEEPTFHFIMNIESEWMEIAVISLAGVAARASQPIGFADILQDISIYSTEALGISPSLNDLEQSLRSRGFDKDCELIGWEAWVDSFENGMEEVRSINSENMGKACTPTLLRIREAVKTALEQLNKEKRILAGNMTIHLTGEYSNIPGFAELLGRKLQRNVKVSKKSTEAGYHGTASILKELNDLIPYVTAKKGNRSRKCQLGSKQAARHCAHRSLAFAFILNHTKTLT